MALKLITPPAVEALSLAEVKEHLRVVSTHEDSLIELYIKAARQRVEGPDGFTGRVLVTQTWDLYLDEFPPSEILIPLPPLQSISFIHYNDAAGDEQEVSASDYYVDTASEPGWVTPLSSAPWPTPIDAINSVRIRFVAGYLPSSDSPPSLTANIPENIKAAMLLMIGTMYENREGVLVGSTVAELPWGVDALLRQSRVNLGMA